MHDFVWMFPSDKSAVLYQSNSGMVIATIFLKEDSKLFYVDTHYIYETTHSTRWFISRQHSIDFVEHFIRTIYKDATFSRPDPYA